MKNIGEIKDLYISPDFITEKTVNERLFYQVDDAKESSGLNSFGDNSPNLFSQGNGQATERPFDKSQNIDVSTDNITGDNAQTNKNCNDASSTDTEKVKKQNFPDKAPEYEFGNAFKPKAETKIQHSKEYLAYEQYKKYLEKHDKFAKLAKNKSS